jgi:hypothetical protein
VNSSKSKSRIEDRFLPWSRLLLMGMCTSIYATEFSARLVLGGPAPSCNSIRRDEERHGGEHLAAPFRKIHDFPHGQPTKPVAKAMGARGWGVV